MPKEIKDIKEMIKFVKGEGKNIAPAKKITIKKNKGITKFKVRTPRYLYTLKVDNQEKADRIMQAIPPTLSKVTIEKKGKRSAK